MAWEVVFSARSKRDLREIAAYISCADPPAAEKFANALVSAAETLGLSPRMGVRYQRDESARYVVYRSYLIIYDLEEEDQAVVIRRFWHGARRPWTGTAL